LQGNTSATTSVQTRLVAAAATTMIDGDLRELFKNQFQVVGNIGEEPKRFWKVDSFSERRQLFTVYFLDDNVAIELERNELVDLICESYIIL
jgi:hypothetical protein